MANDSKIVITAGLQIPETVSTVEKELKVVGEKVSADRALKIVANVDLSKTTQRIQSQLATITKDLKLDISGVNVSSTVMQTVSAVQNSISKVGTNINIQPKIDSKAVENVSDTLKNFGIGANNVERLTKYLSELDITITKIAPKFVEVANGGKLLDTVTIQGIDKQTGSLVKIVDQLDNLEGKTAKTTYTITQNLASVEKENKKVEDSAKAAQLAYNDFLKLKGQADLYSKKFSGDDNLKTQLADIQKLVAEFDNTQPVEKQRESIIRIDNALKIVKADIDAISKAALQTSTNVDRIYPNLSFNKSDSSTAILTDAKNQLNTFFNAESIDSTASRVKRAVEDASGSLQRFYVQIERGDKSVETLTYALNEQGNAYEYLGKVVREADNSTDFRRKGLDTQIEIQTQKVEQFAETVGKSQEATAILGNDIAKLREDISKVGDTNAMNAFLDNFDIAKAKFGAISAQLQNTKRDYDSVNKSINDNIKSLEKFNNSTVAKNNASNPTVVSQTGLNADLINQLRGLQESLANDKSPENIARITARMNELGNSLRDAKFNSEALDQSLRDESSAAKLNANISKLTNQMDIFANTNRKATESLRLMRDGETTFAAKWQELTAAIRSGNLSAEDLRRLSDEFRVFRGEADAAGLTVSRFFQSMQSQLRMVLQRWISLYAVIGYIRKMIDNVKELDNAMINLRRVTDETDAGYQRFLEDANQLARQMKTTTASLVEMSYQWSKLGFAMDEALELSKASTIFMRVADVGQDQALSNLVTSLKAFRLEASQTMDVVDKLDKLNNEYAVSASGLGQGLERSASAMAMTGNSLEETLAMLTGAGEITQNLENTGNALRVISLR